MKAGLDQSFQNARDGVESIRPEFMSLPALQRSGVRLSLVPRLLILGVCGWSLIEMPAEFDPAAGELGVAALALAKIAWTGSGSAAARGIRRAQWIFSFLCGLSLVAVVPALPVELNESGWIFAQSLVECVLKAGALFALAISRATRSADASVARWHDDDGSVQRP